MKTETIVEWNEPGIGVCRFWQTGPAWWQWSTPWHDGTCASAAECCAEIRDAIDDNPFDYPQQHTQRGE